jgi:hypothetical protein
VGYSRAIYISTLVERGRGSGYHYLYCLATIYFKPGNFAIHRRTPLFQND